MHFEGIYTPVVTPHREDHSIDEARFAEVIEFLIAAGVNGLIVAGTTGEYYAQSPEERVRLMSVAKEIIAGFEAAQAEGKGVVVVNGRLVENLHVEEAKRQLALAEAIAQLQ